MPAPHRSSKRRGFTAALALLVAVSAAPWTAGTAHATDPMPNLSFQIITTNPAGQPANNSSSAGHISPDLRYVMVQSQANDLVPSAHDEQFSVHVYVADTVSATISQIDVNPDGTGMTGTTYGVGGMSDDGRYVAYYHIPAGASTAKTILVDRVARTTSTPCGNATCDWMSFSSDNHYMVFAAYNYGSLPAPYGERHVYAYDLTNQTMTVVDPNTVNPHCVAYNAQAGPDDWVYWAACSTNLVSGAGGSHSNLFRRNLITGQTQVIDTTAAGLPGDGDVNGFNLSADGRYVAFDSLAHNLVPGYGDGQWRGYLKNLQTGALVALGRANSGPSYVTTAGALYQSTGGFTADDSLVICTSDPLLVPQGTGAVLRHPDGTLQWFSRACPHRISDDGMRFVFSTTTMPDGSPIFGQQLALGTVPWYDPTPPVVTGTADRAPNAAGWYRTPVTITWSATDPPPSSGTPTTPPPTVVSSQGAAQLVTSQASCDPVGNCASGQYGPVNLDSAAPTIAAASSPAVGAGKWTNQDVTVTFSCADALSLIATCTTPIQLTTEGADQQVSGTATDNAGNSATRAVTVNIDKTPPVITATLSQEANGSGWNNGPVTVTFACSDALSGVNSCPAPATISQDGADQVVTASATDNAGNTAATAVTVSIDTIRPQITATRTSANAQGWNNGPVTVTYACADESSGVADCPPATVLSGEGTDQSATGTAVDHAGNTASVTVDNISIDLTAPTISRTIAETPNAAGWYRIAPTITYSCADSLSQVRVCPAPTQLTGDGPDQTIVATTEDNAGNTAAVSSTLNIDRTPPLVTVTGVVDGAMYPLSQMPVPGCVSSDSTSGLAASADATVGRDAAGLYTVTCSGAIDQAGNAGPTVIAHYTVTATAGTLTAVANTYVLGSASPNTDGVLQDLDNKLAHNQICLFIRKVLDEPSAPNPTLTTVQAAELVYWAKLLDPGCP